VADKPDVLLTAPVAYEGTMRRLDEVFALHRYWEAADQPALIRRLAPVCRAVATPGAVAVAPEILAGLPKLGIVGCFGVGYDAVDVAACTARGIAVTNTPDVLTDEVADLALGLLLAVARRIVKGDRYVRAGHWVDKGNMAMTPSLTLGKKAGIVGLGRIGKAIARRLNAFGVEVSYFGRHRQSDVQFRYYGDLMAMARDVEFLILSCPGGAATRHIVDAGVLQALGPKGILVNVARGTVVDDDALIAALKNGTVGGAALDVFVDEPRVPAGYLEIEENLVLQPHHASATHETRGAMGQMMIDNILAFLAGKPLLSRVN
jgi:lactate dehydrogenase-like 2-hydroxyacid dehydrogenase